MLQKIGVYEVYLKYQITSLFILLHFIYTQLERMLERLDLLFSTPAEFFCFLIKPELHIILSCKL